MTAKKLLTASALLLGATLATTPVSLAQGYYSGPYGYGFGYGYGYGYAPYDGASGFGNQDRYRGGPGPRVYDGSGMGIGNVR